MPLNTNTALKGRTAQEKRQIGDAIQSALVASGVPETDRFQRFIDLDPENFLYDLHYPDLEESRSQAFTVIEILLSVGRSVKVKRKILETLVHGLTDLGMSPNDIFVCFKETAWENWAFAKGEIYHV